MFNFFKSSKAKTKEETKGLLATLYYMMMTDDKVAEIERGYFRDFCKEKGFTTEEVSEIVSNNSVYSKQVPKDRNKQEEFFSEMVAMVLVDGHVSPDEKEHLAKYAKLLNLAETDEEIQSLIEEAIRQKNEL